MSNAATNTTTQDAIEQLGEIAIINLDVSIWSGQTALKASDLKLGEGGELPPETIALLGNKRICPREDLKIFHTLKERARRHIQEHGLPFVGGYAVPVERVPLITQVLDEIMLQLQQAKASFLANYENAIESWILENPGYEALIRSGVQPKATIAGRITSGYQVFQLSPVAGAENGLATASEGLAGDLIAEVQREAKTFYEKHMKDGQDYVDGRTYKTWPPLVKKVQGLTFLDARFDALERLLVEMGHCYPLGTKGGRSKVIGADYHQLRANVLILSTDRIEDYLDGRKTDSLEDEDLWGSDEDVLEVPSAEVNATLETPVPLQTEASPQNPPQVSQDAPDTAMAEPKAEIGADQEQGFDDLENLLTVSEEVKQDDEEKVEGDVVMQSTELVDDVVTTTDELPVENVDALFAELEDFLEESVGSATLEPEADSQAQPVEKAASVTEGLEKSVASLGSFDPDAMEEELDDAWF